MTSSSHVCGHKTGRFTFFARVRHRNSKMRLGWAGTAETFHSSTTTPEASPHLHGCLLTAVSYKRRESCRRKTFHHFPVNSIIHRERTVKIRRNIGNVTNFLGALISFYCHSLLGTDFKIDWKMVECLTTPITQSHMQCTPELIIF